MAPHADAGLTVMHVVRKAVPLLGPGTRVVVVGVGGLGHIGVQCLRALTAAEVIAVDPDPEALKLATDCGAHHARSTRPTGCPTSPAGRAPKP